MAQSGSHDITSDDEDINHVSASVTGPHGYMGNGASMKPKFDAMLKEIEQKLPSLDDDDSDFEDDSDDEVEIFQRPSSYGQLVVEDADKDLDESLTSSDLNDRWSWKTMPDTDDENISNSQGTESIFPTIHTEENEPVSVPTSLADSLFPTVRSDEDRELESLMSNITFSGNNVESRLAWPEDSSILISESDLLSEQLQRSSDILNFTHQSQRSDIINTTERQSRPTRRDQTRNSSAMRLSLGTLENVDLDIALQTVVEDGHRRQQRSRSSSTDLFDIRPGDNRTSQRDPNKSTELMQRLVNLSTKQSGQKLDIDPMSGADRAYSTRSAQKSTRKSSAQKSSFGAVAASATPPLSKYEAEAVTEKEDTETGVDDLSLPLRDLSPCPAPTNTTSSSVSSGTSTNITGAVPNFKVLSARPPDQRFQGIRDGPEPPRDTVFLDLRKSEQLVEEERNRLAVVQRVLKINKDSDDSSSSSSESSEEDDRESWIEQRQRIRQAIARGEAPPAPVQPFRIKTPKRKVPPPRRLVAAATSRNAHSPAASSSDTPTASAEEGPRTPPSTPQPNTDSNVIDEANELEKQRKLEASEKIRKAKLEAEKILKSKQTIGNQLNGMRPTVCVDSRRKSALITPTLYHMESSYEPELSCLPSNISDHEEITLLTINLSSNGEIMAHRSQASNTLDKGDSWSVSYLALVTWLCSLIPNNVSQLVQSVTHPFPFNVLGLQQMLINGKLILAVAVTPSSEIDERTAAALKKSNKKGPKQTNFQLLLNKFFSTKTLSDVNPWLADCVSQPIKASASAGEAQYLYTPPPLEVTNKPLSTFIQVQTNEASVKKYFEAEIGFFWQTVRNEENSHYADDELQNLDENNDIQNTLVLIYKHIYRDCTSLFAVLSRLLQNGLDISGLRLASPNSKQGVPSEVGPILAVGIRGTLARPVWLEELGPMDPVLARHTDPNSLIALYGGQDRNSMTLFTPRNPIQVTEELCRWFGGRVPDNHMINTSTISFIHNELGGGDALSDSFTAMTRISPISLLSATVTADIFLVISPLLPIKCIGIILAACQRRGFLLRGIRRRRLSPKQVSSLGIGPEHSYYFTADYSNTPSSPRTNLNSFLGCPTLPYSHHDVPRPALILQLSKENALHNSSSLVENFMVQLTLQGLLDGCNEAVDGGLTSSFLFHVSPYSDGLLTLLGREFTRVPELDSPASTGYIAPKLYSNIELEQISVLTLCPIQSDWFHSSHVTRWYNRHDCISEMICCLVILLAEDTVKYSKSSITIARLLNTMPHRHRSQPQLTTDPEGLELLGIKWLPALNSGQAKELTPYEVGHPEWKTSVKQLSAEPAVILVFRGLNCNQRIKDIISSKPNRNEKLPLDRMVSPTPELAYRLVSLFFFDRELFADNENRPLMPYLPPLRSEIKSPADSWDDESLSTRSRRPRSGRGLRTPPKTPPKTPPQSTKFVEESICKTMQMGPRPISTLLIMKPSALSKKNLAKLLRGLFLERFHIVGLRLVRISELEAACLQSSYIRKNDDLYREDIAHMTSGDSLVLAVSRENAVKKLLDLLGPEDSREAKRLDPFLWRGMYGTSVTHNAFYASKSYAAAVADIKKFFSEGLCCNTNIDLTADDIPCPGVDRRLSANSRVAQEQIIIDSGPYNLARLYEVNCIVMLPPLVRMEAGQRDARYTDIIQCLQKQEVSIVGARMLWMTEDQAQDYLHVINAGNFSQVPLLSAAPILVLAVQCEHAVISFDYIMEVGMIKINKSKDNYMKYLQVAKDISSAGKMLSFFFDVLHGENCKMKICSRSQTDHGE